MSIPEKMSEQGIPESIHLLVDRALNNSMNVTEAKLSAINARIDNLKSDLSRIPQQLDNAIDTFRDVVEARMQSLNSDLSSVKSVIAKMETSFIKSTDALMEMLRSSSAAVDSKTENLRDRMTTIEARTIENRTHSQDSSARLFSVIAIVVSVAIGVGEIYTGLKKSDTDAVIFDSVQKLQQEQVALSRSSARNPVEKSDVELLSQRLDALSRRLNNATGLPLGPSSPSMDNR